jgi:hypothetical protein
MLRDIGHCKVLSPAEHPIFSLGKRERRLIDAPIDHDVEASQQRHSSAAGTYLARPCGVDQSIKKCFFDVFD